MQYQLIVYKLVLIKNYFLLFMSKMIISFKKIQDEGCWDRKTGMKLKKI